MLRPCFTDSSRHAVSTRSRQPDYASVLEDGLLREATGRYATVVTAADSVATGKAAPRTCKGRGMPRQIGGMCAIRAADVSFG